jgi:hypothetical protein
MDIYWNIFTMHVPMNVKFPNNTSKWQMEFNSEFKGLRCGSVLYVEEQSKAMKLYIKLIPIPATIIIGILLNRGRKWNRLSLSVWFHYILLHNCFSVLTMYQLQLYLESTEIMDDCFDKLQITGRESLVVYFITFMNGFPHANGR